jgi:hypothetical protein
MARTCTPASVLASWFFGFDHTPCPRVPAVRCGACGPCTGYDAAEAGMPSRRIYQQRTAICVDSWPRPRWLLQA